MTAPVPKSWNSQGSFDQNSVLTVSMKELTPEIHPRKYAEERTNPIAANHTILRNIDILWLFTVSGSYE